MKIRLVLSLILIFGFCVPLYRSGAQIPGQPTPIPPQMGGSSSPLAWWNEFQQEIPLLGEGNWVVIGDAAYPWQVEPGIEMVNTGEDAQKVLSLVLGELDKAHTLRVSVWTAAEMNLVQEIDAKGITDFRTGIKKAVQGRTAKALPHDQIVSKVLDAGKDLHVLVLKTNNPLPYSTIFLEVHGSGLSPEAEKHLEDAMKSGGGEASPSPSGKNIPKTKKHGAKE